MKLNCQAGDLAIVVKADPQFPQALGQIVRCESLIVVPLRGDKYFWILEEPIRLEPGVVAGAAADSILRPLRDTPGEDETLRWKERETT